MRHVGSVKQHRLCYQCHAWWRTTLNDPSAVRGTSYRADDGPFGSWSTTHAFHAYSIYRGERDIDLLDGTVHSGSTTFRPIDVEDLTREPFDGRGVLFIGAGKLDRATSIVRSVPESARRRCVIVARPDCVQGAMAAMSLGAGDLLVSPLSPQQVTGSFDRLGDASRLSRDGETGLPILTETAPKFGQPGHLIRVQPATNADLMPTVMLLRRYLLGYDRVGVDGKGGAVAVVYCPAEHLSAVVQRMPVFLGGRVRIESVAPPAALKKVA